MSRKVGGLYPEVARIMKEVVGDLSIRAASEKAGVSYSTIFNMLHGRRASLESTIAISAAFDLADGALLVASGYGDQPRPYWDLIGALRDPDSLRMKLDPEMPLASFKTDPELMLHTWMTPVEPHIPIYVKGDFDDVERPMLENARGIAAETFRSIIEAYRIGRDIGLESATEVTEQPRVFSQSPPPPVDPLAIGDVTTKTPVASDIIDLDPEHLRTALHEVSDRLMKTSPDLLDKNRGASDAMSNPVISPLPPGADQDGEVSAGNSKQSRTSRRAEVRRPAATSGTPIEQP